MISRILARFFLTSTAGAGVLLFSLAGMSAAPVTEHCATEIIAWQDDALCVGCTTTLTYGMTPGYNCVDCWYEYDYSVDCGTGKRIEAIRDEVACDDEFNFFKHCPGTNILYIDVYFKCKECL